MERLSDRALEILNNLHRERLDYNSEYLPLVEALNRLSEYEDTQLPPNICTEYKTFEDEAISNNVTFKRIVELMNAESAGRLTVLPCKVGDTVYQIDAVRVYESIVRRLIFDTNNVAFDERAIGKTVFLAREDAEVALKEGNNGCEK